MDKTIKINSHPVEDDYILPAADLSRNVYDRREVTIDKIILEAKLAKLAGKNEVTVVITDRKIDTFALGIDFKSVGYTVYTILSNDGYDSITLKWI